MTRIQNLEEVIKWYDKKDKRRIDRARKIKFWVRVNFKEIIRGTKKMNWKYHLRIWLYIFRLW